MIDIEKIKTNLSHRSEKDKEFLLKKFNQDEVEQMNYNLYEKELFLNCYLDILGSYPLEKTI